MNQKDAQILIDTIKGLVGGEPTRETVATGPNHKLVRPVPAAPALAMESDAERGPVLRANDEERLYQRFKARLIDEARIDPILLSLLTTRNEIEVLVERRTVQLEGSSLKGRIAQLMANGFYAVARGNGATRTELKKYGSDPSGGNIANAMNDFCRDGYVVREGDAYILAPGTKITEREVSSR